jgi:hypothetical protein
MSSAVPAIPFLVDTVIRIHYSYAPMAGEQQGLKGKQSYAYG